VVHAVVLGSGVLWALLRPDEEVRTGDALFVSVRGEPEERALLEEELPTEELPEVEFPEDEPLPEAEEAPDDSPLAEELPPPERPPPEEAIPAWALPVDAANKRTRPRATTPPVATSPAPPVAPATVRRAGTRTPLQALRTPAPPFPRHLVPPGARAVLWLTYTIAPDGTILEAVVSETSGYPAVDEAVRDFVVRTWRYAPPGSTRRVKRRFVFDPAG
jgi:TonB family protein